MNAWLLMVLAVAPEVEAVPPTAGPPVAEEAPTGALPTDVAPGVDAVAEPGSESEAEAPTEAPTEGAESEADPEADPEPEPEPELANPEDAEAATEEAAPAKLGRPAPPPKAKRGAMGTGGQTPLPAAPPPEDPASIRDNAWRGRFELDFQVGVVGPLAGTRPAAGTVVSAYGALGFAARLHPMVALGIGATTYIHDSGQRTLIDSDGNEIVEQGLGRLTLFDAPTLRVFWPAAKRIEPYGLVATSFGVRREPLTGRGSFAVGVRGATGVDFWLGPAFTLGAELGYRALFIERSAGHAMQGGLRFAIHW